MSDAESALPVTDQDRERISALIWSSHAVAMLEAARASNPSAATLNVIRAWLVDNGVSMNSLRHIGGVSERMNEILASVPRFNGDDPTPQ